MVHLLHHAAGKTNYDVIVIILFCGTNEHLPSHKSKANDTVVDYTLVKTNVRRQNSCSRITPLGSEACFNKTF